MRARRPGLALATALLAPIGLLALSLAAAPAAALTLTAELSDLEDLPLGGDLWQADYTISDFVFAEDQGFSIEFSPLLYAGLTDPEPGVHAPQWDVLLIQPSPTLPDVGLYDALARVDAPDDLGRFRVRFTWLGGPGTVPGPQAFTVNEFDASGALVATLEAGTTQVVPEPGAAVLALAALPLWLRRRR